ncbi:MAG: RNA polymerase sigma factor [Thalassobaculum sp.]|uniref:RNA polymerase sigma factor n=1 Tax=Thalassobaculum sp. TaxID=2022740 RepID=UPI0032EC0815
MKRDYVSDVEALIPTLQRFARSLARNAADADDLLQDTLERALGRAHQFEPGTNLRAWMFTIMRNRFYTECRRRQRVRDHAAERHLDAADGEVAVLGDQMARVEACEFSRAFAKLSGDERSLLVMATVEEMPYETIAQLLDVEVGTVKSRVSRTRAKLRRLQEADSGLSLARAERPAAALATIAGSA